MGDIWNAEMEILTESKIANKQPTSLFASWPSFFHVKLDIYISSLNTEFVGRQKEKLSKQDVRL